MVAFIKGPDSNVRKERLDSVGSDSSENFGHVSVSFNKESTANFLDHLMITVPPTKDSLLWT